MARSRFRGGRINGRREDSIWFAKELVTLYAKELVSSKDIVVAVQSASFPVFVPAPYQRPGKVFRITR